MSRSSDSESPSAHRNTHARDRSGALPAGIGSALNRPRVRATDAHLREGNVAAQGGSSASHICTLRERARRVDPIAARQCPNRDQRRFGGSKAESAFPSREDLKRTAPVRQNEVMLQLRARAGTKRPNLEAGHGAGTIVAGPRPRGLPASCRN
jgi:hypothetical protein